MNKNKENKPKKNLPNFFIGFTDLVLCLLICFILIYIVSTKNEASCQQKLHEFLEGKENFNVRENIAKELEKNFVGFPNVEVDKLTGDVTILNNKIEFIPNQSLLVNYNDSANFILQFMGRYLTALKSSEYYDKYVQNIVIEGHTARYGTELDQMELSLQRAYTVYNIIYNNRGNLGINEQDIKKIESTGRGSQVLRDSYNVTSRENRRVAFHFVLNESQIIKDYNSKLENEKKDYDKNK